MFCEKMKRIYYIGWFFLQKGDPFQVDGLINLGIKNHYPGWLCTPVLRKTNLPRHLFFPDVESTFKVVAKKAMPKKNPQFAWPLWIPPKPTTENHLNMKLSKTINQTGVSKNPTSWRDLPKSKIKKHHFQCLPVVLARPSGWIARPNVVAACIGDGGAQAIWAKTSVSHLGAGGTWWHLLALRPNFWLRICQLVFTKSRSLQPYSI